MKRALLVLDVKIAVVSELIEEGKNVEASYYIGRIHQMVKDLLIEAEESVGKAQAGNLGA